MRPSEIEAFSTADAVVSILMSRDGFFSYRFRTSTELVGGALVLQQENGAAFRIYEDGSVLVSVPIDQPNGHMKPLIEENVHATIGRSLALADRFLSHFDETQRLTRVVLVVGIGGAGPFGWRTSSEHSASSGSMTMSINRTEPGPVHLNPPDRTRMALRSDRTRLTDDLLALLRRQHRA